MENGGAVQAAAADGDAEREVQTSVFKSVEDTYHRIPLLSSGNGSFLLYLDRMMPLLNYSDADVGQIMKALIHELSSGRHVQMPPYLEAMLEMIALQIFRDRKKYEEKCETNRKNARARWGKTATNDVGTKDAELLDLQRILEQKRRSL